MQIRVPSQGLGPNFDQVYHALILSVHTALSHVCMWHGVERQHGAEEPHQNVCVLLVLVGTPPPNRTRKGARAEEAWQ
jgi:hypothetical protein